MFKRTGIFLPTQLGCIVAHFIRIQAGQKGELSCLQDFPEFIMFGIHSGIYLDESFVESMSEIHNDSHFSCILIFTLSL